MSASKSSHPWLHQLYQEHRDWLLGWLRRNQSCPARAEDLSQDTFVRLLKRGEPALLREPRALLTTIARGLLIDHFRRSALETAYLQELAQQTAGSQPSAEDTLLQLELLREIDALLGDLSPRARAAFLHSRLDGMPHAEIAERLGVSVPRVRQYLAQGLRQCYVALYGTPQ